MLRYVGNNNEIILFKSLIFPKLSTQIEIDIYRIIVIDLAFSIRLSNKKKVYREETMKAYQVKRQCINILIQRKSLNNMIFYGGNQFNSIFFIYALIPGAITSAALIRENAKHCARLSMVHSLSLSLFESVNAF